MNKWGAKLAGHEFDVADWREEFREPFDPFVKIVTRNSDDMPVLWTEEFADLDSAEEVRQRASVLIHQLNGIMQLERGSEPLAFDGTVEFRGDQVSIHHFAHLTGGKVRARGGAVAVHITQSGVTLPPPPPTESTAQALFKICEKDDVAGDMFAFLANATDWYELYKVIELCEKKGGGQHSLVAALGKDGDEWKRTRVTANFFRHARGHRPDRLVPFDEARAVVLSGIRKTLSHK